MAQQYTVKLAGPASDMAQEEILKQVPFLSREIANARFTDRGAALQFEAPAALADKLAGDVRALAQRVQGGLRGLRRKVVYRAPPPTGRSSAAAGWRRAYTSWGRGRSPWTGCPWGCSAISTGPSPTSAAPGTPGRC